MSVPKYIKELSKTQKKLKPLLILVSLVSFLIWIVHLFIDSPSNPGFIFIYPELYIFLTCLIGYIYLYIRDWKEQIYFAESDLIETIAYRSKTSIKSLANVKKIKESNVKLIIQRLIDQEKLFGIIKDGLFISERTMVPICSLCNKDIKDRFLMVLCPHCKRPYHKDHIIDYINEYEQNCPNCKRFLELADIIK
jgi:hypothetical protein